MSAAVKTNPLIEAQAKATETMPTRPTSKFGWCMTRHHGDCPATLIGLGIHAGTLSLCTCECHGAEAA